MDMIYGPYDRKECCRVTITSFHRKWNINRISERQPRRDHILGAEPTYPSLGTRLHEDVRQPEWPYPVRKGLSESKRSNPNDRNASSANQPAYGKTQSFTVTSAEELVRINPQGYTKDPLRALVSGRGAPATPVLNAVLSSQRYLENEGKTRGPQRPVVIRDVSETLSDAEMEVNESAVRLSASERAMSIYTQLYPLAEPKAAEAFEQYIVLQALDGVGIGCRLINASARKSTNLDFISGLITDTHINIYDDRLIFTVA